MAQLRDGAPRARAALAHERQNCCHQRSPLGNLRVSPDAGAGPGRRQWRGNRGLAIMIRILIADDHEVVRSGLRNILEAQPKCDVVAEASNGKEAVRRAFETNPDVAML